MGLKIVIILMIVDLHLLFIIVVVATIKITTATWYI